MTQKELIYITTVAEAGNISKAAERLFVAQPSLSRCIQKIENDLGVELFKRTPEGLKPTTAGEYYIHCANSILQTYKEMEIQFSRLNEMKTGKLVIGTTVFLGSAVLPHILHVFSELYPNIEISLVESVSIDIENEVLRGRVDLGILHLPLMTDALHCEHLGREYFLLGVPPADPLNESAYREKGEEGLFLDVALTAKRPYVLCHLSQRSRQVGDAILNRAGIPNPYIKYQTKSLQTAARMSGANLGFCLVPRSYCRLFGQEFRPNYYRISDEYQPYWELGACYSKEIPLSKAAEEMLRICRETVPALINHQFIAADGKQKGK